ncbi:response regulator transcription factor [Paenibacillus sp. FJAT-26967]|uniref:response regulator transcription factor n=1 Tax=Paenibacillus sp. FJAT-26967 TaxID=1729690 RepID=UPI000838BEF0|nr:response regulator transcription factor [Paenibacillus sp. FJAT-26967]
MTVKVLVADDEQTIANAIAYGLKREGYTVETAADGEEALRKADSFEPHVLVLDVMMPRMNGFDVCRKLENRKNLGILLLTVKNDMVDKILGLELGADDYMTKPFDLRELIARVKALARRLQKTESEPDPVSFKVAELVIYPEQRSAYLKGEALTLTPKEFDLLALFISHLKRVYTREELLDLVWGMEYEGGTRTVDIHVQRLRTKLGEPYQHLLQTVYGVGYKAIGEVP